MWIEICDKKYQGMYVVNSSLIQAIRTEENDTLVEVISESGVIALVGKQFYHALIMALQGQEVDLGELGHVRPLKNGQREELHKRMMYLETLNDCIFKG